MLARRGGRIYEGLGVQIERGEEERRKGEGRDNASVVKRREKERGESGGEKRGVGESGGERRRRREEE